MSLEAVARFVHRSLNLRRMGQVQIPWRDRKNGTMDVSTTVSLILAHAGFLGLALLLAAVVARPIGRAVGYVPFLVGLVASAYLTYYEWVTTATAVRAAEVAVIGIGVSAFAGWIVKHSAPLFDLVLFGSAWYLVVYSWMGATFTGSPLGAIAWVGAAILSMVATEPLARWAKRREAEARMPGEPVYGGPTGV